LKETNNMKKHIMLGICFLLLLTNLQFGQILGNGRLLFQSPEKIRWTQCAFTPDGRLWVVWVPGTTNANSGGPIWVGTYDGTTFSTPINMTGSLAIKANRPHITTSSKGHVLVAWGVVATRSTYLRIWDPKTKIWGPIETVASNYGGDEPIAQMDNAGNIHVFFTDEAGGVVFARSKINGVWDNIAILNQSRGKQGSLVIGPDGKVHAVWIEKDPDSTYQNYYATRTISTAWETRVALPKTPTNSNHPWISIGSNNAPIVCYQDVPPAENGCEIYVLPIGGTPVRVIPFAMQHFGRVVVDSKNDIHVVCQTGGGDFGSGFRYTNNVGGIWKPFQTFPALYPKVHGLAADSLGNVAVTQSSYTTSGTDLWVYSLNPIERVDMPTADFTFSPASGYPPLAVDIQAVPAFSPNGSEVSYAWTFSDGGSAAGRQTSHVFETHGMHTITLKITDNLGRKDEIGKTIEVKKTDPQIPLNAELTIVIGSVRRNLSITYSLAWRINPANTPAHIKGYAIYMKEGDGEYAPILTVSPSTFDSSFTFTDLKVKRYFAVSTLGYGGTESAKVYFQ